MPGFVNKAIRKIIDLLIIIDMDTMEHGMCWQPLLLEFNGIELELK